MPSEATTAATPEILIAVEGQPLRYRLVQRGPDGLTELWKYQQADDDDPHSVMVTRSWKQLEGAQGARLQYRDDPTGFIEVARPQAR